MSAPGWGCPMCVLHGKLPCVTVPDRPASCQRCAVIAAAPAARSRAYDALALWAYCAAVSAKGSRMVAAKDFPTARSGGGRNETVPAPVNAASAFDSRGRNGYGTCQCCPSAWLGCGRRSRCGAPFC